MGVEKPLCPQRRAQLEVGVCLLAASLLIKVTFLSAGAMYTNVSWWIVCFVPS